MFIPLTPGDLADTRFVVSPWWETLTAVKALATNSTMHRPWSEDVRRQMAALPEAQEHWAWLRAFILVRNTFMADALTPTPREDQDVATTRRAVEGLDPEVWRADVIALRSMAEQPRSREVLDAFELSPQAGVARLADAVEWFHELAVAPHWARIRAVHLADIDHRTKEMAKGGLERVLRELHPQIRRTNEGLDLAGKCCSDEGFDVAPGLTLLPCAFAWPGVMALYMPGHAAAVTYVPRGVGTLWESASVGSGQTPLSELLGCTRANILRSLDVPMTTKQLSDQLCMAAGTVSAHLKILTQASLLAGERHGREVFYARSALGGQLAGV